MVKMIWLLILLTTTFCAPIIRDPFDLLTELQTDFLGDKGVKEDSLDIFVNLLVELVAEFRQKERYGALNKLESEEIVQLLGDLDDYIRYKEALKRTPEVSHFFSRLKELEKGEEFINTSVEEDSSTKNDQLFGLFEYIDINIEDILEELIYMFSKDAELDKIAEEHQRKKEDTSTEFLEAKVHDIEDLISIALSADDGLQQSDKILKRAPTATDLPKEAPLIDVEVQVESTKKTDELNLRRMYEKRGAICTLVTGYSKTPIYVISTCRLGFTRSYIWELCEHREPFSPRLHQASIIDITQTPVQDNDGFVYRNVYCAQCNDVKTVHAWTTKIDCEDMQPLSLSDGTDQVTLMREFDDQSKGCVRRLGPAIPRMIRQCSHIDIINTMRYHTIRVGEGSKTDNAPFPLSFSILMNFGFDGKTHILFSTTASQQSTSIVCNVNEKYDPQFQKCRPIVCYDGYHLIDGTCVKIPNEVNPEPDDLSNLQNIDEPLMVILTIKNITYGDICMMLLDGIEDLVIYNLATMFNISAARIQNLTIDLVNSTELANRTGDSIEIHRFTTPLPSKIATHVHVSKTLGFSELGSEVLPTQGLHDLTTKREREPTRDFKVYENPIIHQENDEGSYSLKTSAGMDTQNDYELSLKMKGGENKENLSDMTDKLKKQNDSKQMKSEDGVSHEDTSSILPVVPDCFWAKNLGLAVRITFVLKPAHKNRTILEKSVKTVVQTMSDLVYSNAFMLAINGTDFKVQSVENTPHGSSMDDFCKKGVHPLLDDTEFDIIRVYDNRTKESVTVISVNKTGQRYFPGQYDLSVNIDGNVGNLTQTIISSWVFVCEMPKIVDKQCGRVTLMKGEYQLFENKSIGFVNRTYTLDEYEYVNEHDETVRICTPSDWAAMQQIQAEARWTLACGEDLIKVVIAESYLSFILGVVSLICMLSVLITYGLFDKLRNLPGANTMNLTFSLFMGELVFITSGWIKPHQVWLCSVVGMFLHYLFLASFFWMNVMAFDVYRTFGNKCILTRIRKKKKYLPRYCLYAWGCPLLIVIFCGVLDFTDLVEGVDIGYGGNSAVSAGTSYQAEVTNSTDNSGSHVYRIGCWIQRPVASMVAFGGPMILILSGNAVMFIRTIIRIRAVTRDARSSVRRPSIKRMSGRDDVMLYIRMSTVMGFTWVFGLASSVISAFAGPTSHTICIALHLLGILFIVFNCSQGIFICFAFLFNRRILALFKGLIVRIKTGRPRPISISSSRVTLTTNVSLTSMSHIT